MIGLLNDNLKSTGSALDEAAKITAPGQASWAVPSLLKICAECRFWGFSDERGTDKFGGVAARACKKALDLTGKRMAKIKYNATACKFYEAKK